MIVLVTGGARSGKSSFAEKWCMKHAESAIYIATAQAFDEEMKERIALHRAQREDSEFSWLTLEESFGLPDKLRQLSGKNGDPQALDFASPVVLVDCLTLWLSNILLQSEHPEGSGHFDSGRIMEQIQELVAAAGTFTGTVVFVTNEVGDGIVPEYALGRLYRDLAGNMNARMARVAEQVFLVTAGIPIELKSREYLL